MQNQQTQEKVKIRSLKLNTSNRKSCGAWQLYLEKGVSPVLKQDEFNHWSKYNCNLNNAKLEGDALMELQKFWNAIEAAFISIVNVNKGLRDYDSLTNTF